MKWKKFTLKTLAEAEDIVIATLAEAGIEGVEIEDKVPLTEKDKEQMFVDILPDAPDNDGIAYLNFYLEEDADVDAILPGVQEALEELRQFMDIGEASIAASETEDKDWINNWKQYFKQFYVDDLLIIPSWEEIKPEDQDRPVIHIDPGTAFGTGMHETTQLCIRQLLKYIRGNDAYTPENRTPKVLDVGCGSGILSIVALKLGASAVVGTDLDPDCMTSTHENMAVNHLDAALGTFYVGNLIDDAALQEKVGTEEYDIVVANILADVIIPMAPVIPARLKKGGYFITSGIIDFKENAVKEAIEAAGLTVVEVNHQGEWVNITARKPE